MSMNLQDYWNTFPPLGELYQIEMPQDLALNANNDFIENFTLSINEHKRYIDMYQIPHDRRIKSIFVKTEGIRSVTITIGGNEIISVHEEMMAMLNHSEDGKVDILSPFGLVLPQLNSIVYMELLMQIMYKTVWEPSTIGFWLDEPTETEFSGSIMYYQPVQLHLRDNYYPILNLTKATHLLLVTSDNGPCEITIADNDGDVMVSNHIVNEMVEKLPDRRQCDHYEYHRMTTTINVTGAFIIYPNRLLWQHGMAGKRFEYVSKHGK
jgi:hypothetical protein